jgi:hypothetical protein
MTARNWDMNRRRAPVRARGGQFVGANPSSRPDWRPPLAALGVLLPGLSADGLALLEARLRYSSAHSDFKRRLHQLYAIERERRATGGAVGPGATADCIRGLGLGRILGDLPASELQQLAETDVPDGLEPSFVADVERLKTFIRWMLVDLNANEDEPAVS